MTIQAVFGVSSIILALISVVIEEKFEKVAEGLRIIAYTTLAAGIIVAVLL